MPNVIRNRKMFLRLIFSRVQKYQSLLRNDRWVIETVFRGKRGGFFVEAGAQNGVSNSSCYALERHYGWRGICVEPDSRKFQSCVKNRPGSIVDNVALSDRVGRMTFVEAADAGYSGIKRELLRVENRAREEGWVKDQWRTGGPREERQVDVMTLRDLLEKHQAPKAIDYIAMDIEGSEAAAFEGFPFDEYRIGCLSIEGGECDELLESRGFRRVENPFNGIADWEHYFIHDSLHRGAFSRQRRMRSSTK